MATEEGRDVKTCFLRNEPICNVEESAFISLMDNELDGLQKNDKWVRFFEGTGLRDSGEFGCPQYYITEPLRFTEAQLQQARRPRSSRAATMATGPVALQFKGNGHDPSARLRTGSAWPRQRRASLQRKGALT